VSVCLGEVSRDSTTEKENLRKLEKRDLLIICETSSAAEGGNTIYKVVLQSKSCKV